MNEEDRTFLEAHRATRTREARVEATITFEEDDFIKVQVDRISGGVPRSVKRSRQVRDRMQALQFLDEMITP